MIWKYVETYMGMLIDCGGIIGYADGATISNCHFEGKIKNEYER